MGDASVSDRGSPPKKVGWKKDGFPAGLGRSVKHPAWLSRGCGVPCRDAYGYDDWERFGRAPLEIACHDEGGREARVVAMGGRQVRDYFECHYKDRMLDRSLESAIPGGDSPVRRSYDWALRLGAAPREARFFAGIRENRAMWDYVGAFLARSGMLRFHPWIARDVEEYVQKSGLPLDEAYDAVHVRRGDASEDAAGGSSADPRLDEGEDGWGIPGPISETFGRASRTLEDERAVPFVEYLRAFNRTECDGDEPPRVAYAADDDPAAVRREIDRLPRDSEGYYALPYPEGSPEGDCHRRYRFVLGPSLPSPSDDTDPNAERGDPKRREDCDARYARTVAVGRRPHGPLQGRRPRGRGGRALRIVGRRGQARARLTTASSPRRRPRRGLEARVVEGDEGRTTGPRSTVPGPSRLVNDVLWNRVESFSRSTGSTLCF